MVRRSSATNPPTLRTTFYNAKAALLHSPGAIWETTVLRGLNVSLRYANNCWTVQFWRLSSLPNVHEMHYIVDILGAPDNVALQTLEVQPGIQGLQCTWDDSQQLPPGYSMPAAPSHPDDCP